MDVVGAGASMVDDLQHELRRANVTVDHQPHGDAVRSPSDPEAIESSVPAIQARKSAKWCERAGQVAVERETTGH